MDSTTLATLLQQALPEVQIEPVPNLDLQPTIYVSPADITAVMRELCDRPDLRFAVLLEVTAADLWPREPRFEVIYMVLSIEHHLRLRVKVRLHGADAHVPTLSELWPSANWLEREVWDLFGIAFDGHPDPRRLLMPEDWEGYPLRKDYPVQIRKKPETTEPLQVTAEEFRERVEKDRLARR